VAVASFSQSFINEAELSGILDHMRLDGLKSVEIRAHRTAFNSTHGNDMVNMQHERVEAAVVLIYGDKSRNEDTAYGTTMIGNRAYLLIAEVARMVGDRAGVRRGRQ